MIKVISPDSWDFDAPAVVPVKVPQAGLRGNDYAALVKRAGHPLASWVKDHPPAPGEVLAHLVSMGASETYGGNRNADRYSREMLLRDYPSFEKKALAYRHHDNQNPLKSYGRVKKAMFNADTDRVELLVAYYSTKKAADANNALVAELEVDDLESGRSFPVSQSCFPKGTPVWMADGSRVLIENVRVGDSVVTHANNRRTVTHLLRREYEGDAVDLKVSGLPGTTTATASHRFWVRPKKVRGGRCPVCDVVCSQLASHVWQKSDHAHVEARKNLEKAGEGWVEAKNICKGDWVRTPFDTSVTARGDINYAVLLGYYLSEGCTFTYKKKNGKTIKSPGSRGGVTHRGVDFTFAASEQAFAHRVVSAAASLGFTHAKVSTQPSRPSVLTVRISSPELADKLEADAGRYSYGKVLSDSIMAWSPDAQAAILGAFFDGDGCWIKRCSSLSAATVSERLAYQLLVLLWRVGVPARMCAITPKNPTKRVFYSIDVPSRYAHLVPCGKVPRNFVFSETMSSPVGQLKNQTPGQTRLKRKSRGQAFVEGGFVYRKISSVVTKRLSETVFNLTVDGDHSYVVNGVAVANCTVTHDVCTACGNEAKTRKDYCGPAQCVKYGGCKDNLGRTFNDGFRLEVDNPKCDFFDISRVTRGADPTAFAFGKVAASAYAGGASLADTLGLYLPEHLAPADTLRAIKAAEYLASLEAGTAAAVRLPIGWSEYWKARKVSAPDLSGDRSTKMAKAAALADAGVVLPPDVWLQVYAGVGADESVKVASDMRVSASRLLASRDRASIIGEALPRPDASADFNFSALQPTEFSERSAALASALFPKFASVNAPSIPEGLASDLGMRYSAYQASVLQKYIGTSKEALIASTCVRNNQTQSA